MVGVVQIGLGPIGIGVAKLLAEKPECRIVAAVDPAPDKAGRDLGELIGQPGVQGIRVAASLKEADLAGAEVAVICTGSNLERVALQIREAVEKGLHVVSTNEELAFPYKRYPALSAELDNLARSHGVSIVGVGVNPGYVMDLLPTILTLPTVRVDQIVVTRVVDAAGRRGPLQKKVGVGITPEEFNERVAGGTIRHVGLTESLHIVADSLGWELDEVTESIAPVIAVQETVTVAGTVPAGAVLGVHQIARGVRGDRELLRLDLAMYAGAPDPVDRIVIAGVPEIVFEAKGGIHGDVATWAITANIVGQIGRATPGLRTMRDLAVPRAWCV